MAAALRETFPEAEVGLVPSGGGVFEVSVDEHVVFSKKQLGRHPQNIRRDIIQADIHRWRRCPGTECGDSGGHAVGD